MDFTIVKKMQVGGHVYKLLRANFYRNHYLIIAQSKREFACGSVCASIDAAEELFSQIAQSETEPYTLMDILRDFEMQTV